tara:strand:+ start:469 stop:2169 length:1701 start_codon:yes stop_codon:yes gene_type:complete
LKEYGPQTENAKWIHAWKYRAPYESFGEYATRVANALKDSSLHFHELRDLLREQKFLPGGRVQAAMGSAKQVTPYNCFVSGTLEDASESIFKEVTDAFMTMRVGGGIGYDFSPLRPYGDVIKSLGSVSSGPVSFMGIFDATCATVSSAGHRRGAQMGVLRVDHPDIERFLRAKQNSTNLTAFNVSIAVTDEFMEAVETDAMFTLRFDGEERGQVHARTLWESIMRSTWEWAEPGILFIDRINETNNLRDIENIVATNPCGEQPLPPHGACLLGSFNLTKYIATGASVWGFDYQALEEDIPIIVRAMDNVVDRAGTFPLPVQKVEALSKRRMGIGVTGLANAGEALGYPYGSTEFLRFTEMVLTVLRDGVYMASIDLAEEKGAFPLFNAEQFLGEGTFASTLPPHIKERIRTHGIRNSHLLSIAPTGTISLSADNVSSGIEPTFSVGGRRTVQTENGPKEVDVLDYGSATWDVAPKVAAQCSADDHLGVLLTAQRFMDSACSKTCNVSPDMPWDEFKNIYMRAWKGGAKGCTTFNPGGKRFGMMEAAPAEEVLACYIDPASGDRTCD